MSGGDHATVAVTGVTGALGSRIAADSPTVAFPSSS